MHNLILNHHAIKTYDEVRDKKLIVYIGYGDELPVFVRARSLWEFYLSHFPEINAIFVRTTRSLKRGEITSYGADLLVGVGEANGEGINGPGYRETGVWSAVENADVIFRQMAVYDYLLRKYTFPFFLFQTTCTSVVDFRGLISLLDHLPATRCFAGSPARLNNPSELNGLTFVSGANTVLSRDMVSLLRNRYDENSPYTVLPNDVWQAIVLQDIPRVPLPFISFTKPRLDVAELDAVQHIAQNLIANGHYHFRVKTTSEEDGVGRRENVDPWIMMKIMETILRNDSSPQANLQLNRQFLVSLTVSDQGTVAAYNENPIYSGPRSYPVDDHEAEALFPIKFI